MPHKIEIDLHYIRTRTLWGDVRILMQTMTVPVSKIARRMSGDRRARRIEAGLLLARVRLLLLTFALANSAGA